MLLNNFFFFNFVTNWNLFDNLKINTMGKFEITLRKNGDPQFVLKAANGRVILASQGYKSKKSCLEGIDSVKKNGPQDERFERLVAKNGQPYFNLKASNGQVIGTSEMYSSATAMEKGIASVKKNAADAEVVDLSL